MINTIRHIAAYTDTGINVANNVAKEAEFVPVVKFLIFGDVELSRADPIFGAVAFYHRQRVPMLRAAAALTKPLARRCTTPSSVKSVIAELCAVEVRLGTALLDVVQTPRRCRCGLGCFSSPL